MTSMPLVGAIPVSGDWIETFWQVVAFLTGAVVGSFLNVVIWRLPRGENLSHPPSACPRCHSRIRWFDNVPILAWLLLRGKCRRCQAPISIRYPFVEALTGALFLLAAIAWAGNPVTIAVICLALAMLVAISFIDLDHRLIPDVISIPGIVLGVATAPFTALYGLHHPDGFLFPGSPAFDAVACALAGALVGGGVIQVVRLFGHYVLKKEAMGFGDVKLLAMIGAFVGPAWGLYALVIACFSGAIIGGVAYLVSRRRPLPCDVRLRMGDLPDRDDAEGAEGEDEDEGALRFDRARVRDARMRLQGEPPGPPGTRVTLDVVLDAHRALTDDDVKARLRGALGEASSGAFEVVLDGPFRSAAHAEAFAALDAFADARRGTQARMFLVLGLALGLAGLFALLVEQPLLFRASAVAATALFALAFLRRKRERPCRIEATPARGRSPRTFVATAARLDERRLSFTADAAGPSKGSVVLDIVFPAATLGTPGDVAVRAEGTIVGMETTTGDGARWTVAVDPGFVSEEVDELYDIVETFGQSARYIPFGPFLALAGAAMLLYGPAVAWFITVGYPRWTRSRLG